MLLPSIVYPLLDTTLQSRSYSEDTPMNRCVYLWWGEEFVWEDRISSDHMTAHGVTIVATHALQTTFSVDMPQTSTVRTRTFKPSSGGLHEPLTERCFIPKTHLSSRRNHIPSHRGIRHTK